VGLPDLKVRPAAAEDAKAVHAILHQAARCDPEDLLFWPDHPEPAAVYLHRIAIRRSFAGRGIPQIMLTWAVEYARSLGKKFLRLDCEANRPKLRLLYESFGFVHHSDKQVGPYLVARYEFTLPT
jgi:GNAT superfamily N-acetyltransferase